MSKERPQPPQPTMEDVLRRMLAMPPEPHVKPKPKAKRAKRKAQAKRK